MFLIIVLYLHNECATFWQWQSQKPWQQKCSYCLPFSSPCHSLQAGRSSANLQRALLFPLSFNRLFFFYLSLLLLRNKETIFTHIKCVMDYYADAAIRPFLSAHYFYSLMRQKLPIQLNMLQINLEMHLLGSKRESKLNTTNILNGRKGSGSFCKTHVVTFLFLLLFKPNLGCDP